MPIAFAPLLLLGIEMEWKAAAEGTPSRGWIVAAVAVAMSLYAAFPETAYIDGLFGVAWAAQRFTVLPPGRRFRFAARIAGAAATGVLLAAPYVIPFLHMLTVGDVSYNGETSSYMSPIDGLAVLGMPYVLGPYTFAFSADLSTLRPDLAATWGSLGGYAPVPELVMAVAALFCSRAPHRGLRLVLAAWVAVTIGASFGVPGVTQVVYAVPGLAHTMVFRYAPPSWELAAAILTAMAIGDWQQGRIATWRAIGSAILVGAAAALSLALAWPLVMVLLAKIDPYVWWLAASVSTASAAGIAVAACLSTSHRRWRLAIVLAASVGYALAVFTVPRLSGLREAKIDERAIAFLRNGIGLQRYYSMGPIMPHYGAFFGIASLNSTYLPNPQIWSDHIATALDKATSPLFFFFAGNWPNLADNVAQFVQHLPAYADLAVRYVAVSRGDDTLLRLASSRALPLRLAYEDELMRIFEIETASPYFEAPGGSCRVAPKSRELVVTDCARPARLIRRELFFDGWRATVNGRRVDIAQAGIVQSVEVPAGEATVAFRYLPPYAAVSFGLGLLGLGILAAGSVRTMRTRGIAH